MLFRELCEYFENIEGTSSRNDMTVVLADLFKSLSSTEAQIVAYLVGGRVAPNFVPAEYNFSEKSMIRVLDSLVRKAKLKVNVISRRRELGDIGLTAYEVTNGVGLRKIEEIYDVLWKLVNTTGASSQQQKHDVIFNEILSITPIEAKYLSRIVVGKLRLGSSIKTLLDAFSLMLVGDKSVRGDMDHAYGSSADIGHIASIVKCENALDEIKKVHSVPGVPVLSRLVERVKSFDEVSERLGEKYIVQPKYDGLRCQIHKISSSEDILQQRIWYGRLNNGSSFDMFSKEDSKVRLFTRNLEDVTDMFPEIVDSAKRLKGDSFILDSEIVGWDSNKKEFLSYQDTMTRRRKYGVQTRKQEIPVRAFVFDCIYLNNRDLIEKTTEDRVNEAGSLLKSVKGAVEIAPSEIVTNIKVLRKKFEDYLKAGLEGVVVKDLKGKYAPGSRDFEWLKVKKSIDSALVDSFDLVVLGYYFGSGKRSDFGLGAILGGVYNPYKERFESFTKVGTGITDEMLMYIKRTLKKVELSGKPKNVVVEKSLLPDVWVRPEIVISVEADEVSKNRVDKNVAGGYSLRFPRLIEFDRDKSVDEIATIEEISKIVRV